MTVLASMIRAYLVLASTLLMLTIIVIPFLEPGSPTYIVALFSVLLLVVFIILLLIYGKRVLRSLES